MSMKRRVCVIGAGTAGLSALKNSLQEGMDATAYELWSELGGTWVFSDKKTKCDEDIHTSMYEGLRTNLPKEVMGYPDFKYPDSIKESFVSSNEVLKFLQNYAEYFQLKSHIKFEHEVIRVRPWNNGWEVYVLDKKHDNYSVEFYDYIFVCNGHYSSPQYPKIEGIDKYKGKQLHSHLYRKAETFKDTTVLVIGAGPSGMDIANHISKQAKHIWLSHHTDPAPGTSFMTNVTQKPDVKCFTEFGAVFVDNSVETFDHVIYCTGYKYSFPFLSSDACLRVEDNFVYPLYKHCINIHYPTMALIGLPFYVCPTQTFDLQVRFVLKFFTNQKKLPTKLEMMADLEKELEERWASGLTKRQAHQMGVKQFDYYKELSEIAGISNIKPVIGKMMQDCDRKYIYELESYRDSCFKVIDDETFIKFPAEEIATS